MNTFLSSLSSLPSWVMLAAGFVVYAAALWVIIRLLLRDSVLVTCPRGGRLARVVFRRGPDGRRDRVDRCSVLEAEPGKRCDEDCIHQPALRPLA
jgi:hypothetical protein